MTIMRLMLKSLTPVAALLFGVAILLTGQGLQSTLLPVRANLEAFSVMSIGMMGGAYFLGFTLGCLRGLQLVQKLGHVRVFAAMAAVASAIPLIHVLWVETWVWWLLRLASGFCFAVLYVVIESWLNEKSTNENRGTVFSAYTIISLTLMAAGQQMTQLHDPLSMTSFAIASVIVSFAALPVIMSNSETPQQAECVKFNLRRLFNISRTGMLGCLGCGLANGAFWSLAPVFTAGVSDSISLAAGFMTGTVIGGALGQWPLGLWSDRADRRIVIAAATVLAAVIGTAMWLLSGYMSSAILILFSALWGATAFPLYALAVAHTNDFAEHGEYVMVSAGLLFMYGLGAAVGPALAAGVMTLFSPDYLYLYTAVIHLFLFGYVLVRVRRRECAPMDQHVPFSEALTSVQTASQVFEEER